MLDTKKVCPGSEGAAWPLSVSPGLDLTFEQQKELLLLRMKLEADKELAVEKMRQEGEAAKLERQRLSQIREGRLQLRIRWITWVQVIH